MQVQNELESIHHQRMGLWPQRSPDEVISSVGEIPKEIYFRNPCVCSALFGLFVIFMVVHCFILPSPFGIIFLLKLLRTTPVTEDGSDTPRFIAVQIVLFLCKLC